MRTHGDSRRQVPAAAEGRLSGELPLLIALAEEDGASDVELVEQRTGPTRLVGAAHGRGHIAAPVTWRLTSARDCATPSAAGAIGAGAVVITVAYRLLRMVGGDSIGAAASWTCFRQVREASACNGGRQRLNASPGLTAPQREVTPPGSTD
jgi:hypothetical protein